MSEKTYDVVVIREDDAWLADVPELPGAHTYAGSLAGLDRSVREVVVLMADLPDDALDTVQLAYEYRTGSRQVDDEAGTLRHLRAELDRQSREVNTRTEKLARQIPPPRAPPSMSTPVAGHLLWQAHPDRCAARTGSGAAAL